MLGNGEVYKDPVLLARSYAEPALPVRGYAEPAPPLRSYVEAALPLGSYAVPVLLMRSYRETVLLVRSYAELAWLVRSGAAKDDSHTQAGDGEVVREQYGMLQLTPTHLGIPEKPRLANAPLRTGGYPRMELHPLAPESEVPRGRHGHRAIFSACFALYRPEGRYGILVGIGHDFSAEELLWGGGEDRNRWDVHRMCLLHKLPVPYPGDRLPSERQCNESAGSTASTEHSDLRIVS